MDEYDDDWSRLAWVQLLGRVDIAAGRRGARRDVRTGGEVRRLRRRPPPGPLLRVAVERVG